MIEKFEVGKYYKYTGKCHMSGWSSYMDGVLDGKPRKCISTNAKDMARLENLPLGVYDDHWWWKDGFENWEEVPMLKYGDKVWISDISQENAIAEKDEHTFLCMTTQGWYVTEDDCGSADIWKHAVSVPTTEFVLAKKEGGKIVSEAPLTEEQKKLLGIN